MTDVLGVMESWDEGLTTVRTADGELVTIALGDIVSGKPVPPRAPMLSRLSAEEVERRAVAGWPPVEAVEHGGWLLRACAGYSARANSVLAVGAMEPLAPVISFYAERGLPPWAQVVVGSAVEESLLSAGWVNARPGEAESLFQFAAVARARRAAGQAPAATFAATAWPDVPDAARAVMEGPAEVGFCTLGTEARGRVSVTTHGADVWAGITDVWVSPEARGRGLGRSVMAALLGWAAERGAGTAYLQTRADNSPALRLYDSLGFATHHRYRYLTTA